MYRSFPIASHANVTTLRLVAGAGSGRVSSFVSVFEVVVVSRRNSVCVSKDGDSRSCTYWMDQTVLAVEL